MILAQQLSFQLANIFRTTYQSLHSCSTGVTNTTPTPSLQIEVRYFSHPRKHPVEIHVMN